MNYLNVCKLGDFPSYEIPENLKIENLRRQNQLTWVLCYKKSAKTNRFLKNKSPINDFCRFISAYEIAFRIPSPRNVYYFINITAKVPLHELFLFKISGPLTKKIRFNALASFFR